YKIIPLIVDIEYSNREAGRSSTVETNTVCRLAVNWGMCLWAALAGLPHPKHLDAGSARDDHKVLDTHEAGSLQRTTSGPRQSCQRAKYQPEPRADELFPTSS